ncbi:MAG: CDP-archaeol synthase [Candidatus Gracilibacteria bacterium]|jgi:CDP-2,3-bis-(O-geranylgeranyl)-sn-glycerol synthase|nr:CDP-archaeol synthase [Candidatus Gracilibacteria bacterium]
MISAVLTSFYLFLPAYFANMCPVIAASLKLPLGHPINEKIFGSHKTYRGFIGGFVGALLILIIQTFLFKNGYFVSVSILEYSFSNIPLYAFVFGVGALTGDIVKSFFKRLLKIKPGAPFIPFDQIDFILGAFIFSLIFFQIPLKNLVAALLITPFLHLLTNVIAYFLGLKKVWY